MEHWNHLTVAVWGKTSVSFNVNPFDLWSTPSLLLRQWLPRSKMAPCGINRALDKTKLEEARSSCLRKTVRLAFERAMKHRDRVGGEAGTSD